MSFPNDFFERDEEPPVECEVEYDDIENEDGIIMPGVRVTCTRCNHTEESFGQSDKSIKRCLALLHENCPMDENNWYEV